MRVKSFPMLVLVRLICSAGHQIAAWFESDFCVSCASYLTIHNGPVFARKGDYNFRHEWQKLQYERI